MAKKAKDLPPPKRGILLEDDSWQHWVPHRALQCTLSPIGPKPFFPHGPKPVTVPFKDAGPSISLQYIRTGFRIKWV